MTSGAYELLALLMRYVFVLLGALVLIRAYRWMRRDARNYRREMRSLPDAGLVGEIVDLHTGKSQPLPREGDMGASHECDVHIKGGGVLRHHLRFAFEEGKGVRITPIRPGKTLMGGRLLQGPAYALHGTQLQLGSQAVLRVRLFAGLKVPHPIAFQEEAASPDPALVSSYAAESAAEDADFSFGPDLPAPFDISDAALTPEPDGAGAGAPAVPLPAADYEGHYTEDGQMTWQYAYSLEELYRAQEEQNMQPMPAPADDGEENDEALPYQSPIPRRRRRGRR